MTFGLAPALSQRELNFAVQHTIDRLIFLRICEDRGIEPYGRLMALQNGGQVYERLSRLFRQADDRYNSGLFHFKSERDRSDTSLDALTPNLAIDDKPLKEVLANLYYPDSPYEFSVLPAGILGQVYEQFLGKVIRYGVDIDPQAVEVTKLSLLLKVLEDESAETIGQQLSMFQERALPDLENNIKCGNSLIGPDFHSGQQMTFLDEEEMYRINAFDWQAEFPGIMANGGFDAVIGNPPYVRQEGLGELKSYFQRSYVVYHGVADLYAYFIEKGMSLLKPSGLFGYIVANKWLRANYGKPLRQWLKQHRIVEITDFKDLAVFQTATTYPCVLTIQKDEPTAKFIATQVHNLDFSDLQDYVTEHSYPVRINLLGDSEWSLVDEASQILLNKLQQAGLPLEEYAEGKIYRGVTTGFNKAFCINFDTRNSLINKDPRSAEIIKPSLAGRSVKRYEPVIADRHIIFTRRGINIDEYPAIAEYLSQFKEQLTPRPKNWKGGGWKGRKPGKYQWFEIQDSTAYFPEFENPKIIYPEIATIGQFSLDENYLFPDATTYIIGSSSLYLLGILNSKLWTFIFSQVSSEIRGGFLRWKYQYMAPLPIHTINFNNPTDKARHDQMVALVERMLALHKQLAEAKVPQTKTVLQRQIEATDRQIDQLVYQLYGLTEEEIGIVEGAGG